MVIDSKKLEILAQYPMSGGGNGREEWIRRNPEGQLPRISPLYEFTKKK